MLKAACLSFLLVIFAGISCTKMSSKSASGTGLTGKWLMIEILQDPGNGSGTWQVVAPGDIAEFKDDGSFTCNFSSFKDYIRYEVLTDSTGKIFRADSISLRVPMYYKLSGDLLYLNPQCIEWCGYKFARY